MIHHKKDPRHEPEAGKMIQERYTRSKDGIPRRTVAVKFRLTKEEWEQICSLASARGELPQEMLSNECGLHLEGLLGVPPQSMQIYGAGRKT